MVEGVGTITLVEAVEGELVRAKTYASIPDMLKDQIDSMTELELWLLSSILMKRLEAASTKV